ncbi:helix-turn-helix domain-containing protein [Actinocorallia aurantiaca]|uniref:Helix-turn-helix domain-containing protein n=1 Tax=Actinocorallia aurantiaca TaxID=46204 RepID=A0ABP6H2T7_9ACTN
MTVTALPKALYRVEEALEILSISRSCFYREVKAGRIGIVKAGRSTRVTADSIARFVELLENEAGTA